jgi:hypothetical protein
MNRCGCGSTQIVAEAILVQRTTVQADGSRRNEWAGDELSSVTCAACGSVVRLDPAMTIALMHHLIEMRERGEGEQIQREA